MPKNDKDFKRLIRARMEQTGEAYTTARSRLEGRGAEASAPESVTLPEIRDLLLLAHDIPRRTSRVYAKTTQRWRRGALRMSEKQQASFGRRVMIDRPRGSRTQWAGESWMEFDPASWGSMIGVHPARWREEGSGSEGQGPWNTAPLSASTGSRYWRDGPEGLVITETNRDGRRPMATWICDPFWASNLVTFEVESATEYIGRPAAVVLATPLSMQATHLMGPSLPALDPGDEHRVAIDLATGLSLKRTSYFNGDVILEREVTELSFPDEFPDELFEPPAGREAIERPGPRTFQDLGDLAKELSFPLLVPQFVPEGLQFAGFGSLFVKRDGSRAVSLIYRIPGPSVMSRIPGRSPNTGFSVIEEPESSVDDRMQIFWEELEREGGTLLVSNLVPEATLRDARLVVGETRVSFNQTFLPLEDLIRFAFSLKVLGEQA